MPSPDPSRLASEERADLAALLRDLRSDEWIAESLCGGWTVRDVAIHVASFDTVGPLDLLGRWVRAGLSVDRMNDQRLRELSSLDLSELTAPLDRPLQGARAFLGAVRALTGALIHHQDIRRPLKRPRAIPTDRLLVVLDAVRRNAILGGPKRIRGLRLVTTNLEWSRGTGPEVVGPGEALVMAVAGRPAALADLSGPGKYLLASRMRPGTRGG